MVKFLLAYASSFSSYNKYAYLVSNTNNYSLLFKHLLRHSILQL